MRPFLRLPRRAPPSRKNRGLILALVSTAVLAFGLMTATSPSPAHAQQGACVATINGTDVSDHAAWGDAIRLPYSEEIVIRLLARQPLGDVNVTVTAGPFSNGMDILEQATGSGGVEWASRVSLQDHALFGVGLYKVEMTSESGCNQSLWIHVTGKSFISTVAGGTASIVGLLGMASQGFGWLMTLKRSRAGWTAVLGGVPTGLAMCVVAQQLGWTPLTPQWMVTWTIIPTALGGVVQGGLSSLIGATASRGQSSHPWEDSVSEGTAAEPAPPPPPPTAPPPNAPVPGPPSAGAPTPAREAPPSSAPPPDTGDEPSWAEQQQQQQQQQSPPGPWEGPFPSHVPQMEAPEATPPESVPTGSNGDAGRSRPTRSARSAFEDEVRDPPRSSYALLESPGAVVAEEEFELKFGLSPTEVAGVAGPALERPAGSIGSYFLTVQIVADGFDIRPGERWRHELPVTTDAPYPVQAVHLRAKPQAEAVRSGAIQAIYSVSGQSMGFAVRPVAVVANPSVVATPPDVDAEGATVSVPMDEPAADLTVRIQMGHDPGTLLWTFDTPHRGIAIPDEPVTTSIGDDPQAFARKLVDQMGLKEGQPGVYLSLGGIGKIVADQMPPAFWDLFEDIGDVTQQDGRLPGIFILSEDPYVPWELALVRTKLDATLPQFLGAQACIGRWALGKQRPKLPPPHTADVDAIAVIWGEYNQPGWNRLLEAEQEAASLATSYSAVNVNAARLDVLKCLNGSPQADVLHFAVHGIYDPNSVANGIVLVDGHFLDEFEVRGSDLSHAPFVFLNACQVGSGQAILGDYGGMSHAFLYAGAGGVVAPLWSIKDSIAREIALRFYEQAFTGVPPAEILRRERATFQENLDTTSATCMAYIWYGHPSFTLKRSQGDTP